MMQKQKLKAKLDVVTHDKKNLGEEMTVSKLVFAFENPAWSWHRGQMKANVDDQSVGPITNGGNYEYFCTTD